MKISLLCQFLETSLNLPLADQDWKSSPALSAWAFLDQRAYRGK